MGLKIRSTFLFATPSTLTGVARLFDWGNTFDSYNSSPSNEEADARAAAADWNAVGDEIFEAMAQEHKHEASK